MKGRVCREEREGEGEKRGSLKGCVPCGDLLRRSLTSPDHASLWKSCKRHHGMLRQAGYA